MDMVEFWDTVKQIWEYFVKFTSIINILFGIAIIFFERKNPKSVWAWLFLMLLMPYVGFILYIMAGSTMNKRRMFKDKGFEEMVANRIEEQQCELEHLDERVLPEELRDYMDLVYYNNEASKSILTDENDITFFVDGPTKFAALIEDLKTAEHFICFQYYIIRNDELFSQILPILEERAAAGVEVRVLYDDMGSRSASRKFWHEIRKTGIRDAAFAPSWFRHFNLRVNYRNHRKIVVIDNRIGYLGGFNVGREYIDKDTKKFGHWRDTHMRITGPAVLSLQGRFDLDWAYATHEKLYNNPGMLKMPEYETKDSLLMQIVSSGPDSPKQQIRDNYLRLITRAKHSIYIQSPYFIPDDTIMDALKIAVQSGIEVNIMIPCKPDHPFVYWATHSYVGELIEMGARCYKYQKGFLHAKVVIADEEVFCCGTANMDIRSFALNFEVIATVYSHRKAAELAELIRKDMDDSELVTKEMYDKRKLLIRFKEQVCRLMAPVL